MAKNGPLSVTPVIGLLLLLVTIVLPQRAQQPLMDKGQAYVVGNVLKPMPVPLKESITLTQAISMAGGPIKTSKSDKVNIIRLLDENGRGTTCVSLKEIRKGRTSDMQLQANDILEVVRGDCAHPMCWEISFELDQNPIRLIK